MNGKLRIGNVTATLLITVAALFDLLQFLLTFVPVFDVILCFFLGAVASFLFYVLWFPLIDPSIMGFGGRRGAGQKKLNLALAKYGTIGAAAVISLIPFLDALPEITAGVVMTIVFTRLEDVGVNPSSIGDAIALATSAKRRNEAIRAVVAGNAPKFMREPARQAQADPTNKRVDQLKDRVEASRAQARSQRA